MRSSYSKKSYCYFFTFIAELYKPELIVELGVLDGYSLFYMADGVFEWDECEIIGIDLFEDYPYKHSSFDEVERKRFVGGYDNVELRKQDVFDAVRDFEDESISMLHVDISNDGEKLEQVFDVWAQKVKKGGIILFEGGSEERDKVDWMVKYDKKPIADFKKKLSGMGFEYVTLAPYPSLTICRKVK